MDIEKLVASYVKLRDKKSEMKADFDSKVADTDALLVRVESALLKHFEETGLESARTAAGTAYKSKRVSCTAADKSMFLNFIQENNEWDLADVRPAKAAIATYKENGNELPPGLNWTEEMTVNIRRGK